MRSGEAVSSFVHPREGVFAVFSRQIEMLAGLVILLVVALATAALATWNVADPSLSHATGNPVTNALGYPGAVFSDLAMQFFGLAAVAALVPPVLVGIRLVRGGPIDRRGRRALAWLGSAILAAAMAGCVAAPESWPLPAGLGGVFGDLVLKVPAAVTGAYPAGFTGALVALLLFPAATWLGLYAGAVLGRPLPSERRQPSRREEAFDDDGDDFTDEADDAPGALASAIGLVTHWWLAGRALWRRHFGGAASLHRGRAAMSANPAAGLRAVRIEPVARGDSNAIPEIEPDARAAFRAPPPARLKREPAFEPEEDETEDEDLPALARADLGHGRDVSRGRRSDPSFDDETDDELIDDRFDDADDWDAPARGPATPSAMSAPPRAMLRATPAAAIRMDAPAASSRVVEDVARPRPGMRAIREAQPMLIPDAGDFELPPIHLLAEPKNVARDASLSKDALEQNARLLEGVLEDFGVRGEIIQVRPGPVVTLYELEPAPGIKSSRVIGLADDIARSMSAIAARVAVVPGRNVIGIELPNPTRETVYFRELIASRDYEQSKAKLAMALGKSINGEPVIADLAKMPHLLVAGTTGSGKSVGINAMILSILYKLKPEDCRLIMIDPKMLELSVYDGIPHLLTPVVTDPKKAVVALKWTVREMEQRYKNMSKLGVRNIDGFNARVAQAAKKGEQISRTVQTGFDRRTGEAVYETEALDLEPMPYIVVIIDEMADLMMVAGKDIEGAVQRLAQMARAAGIHVVMATQRPSVDVITGTIKANFPTRISFQVTSKIDSRTILGEQGAEQLLGMGDMLYMAGGGRIQRVHGAFVGDTEVEEIVAHLKRQGSPQYLDAITEEDDDDDEETSSGSGGDFSDSDDPYDQAVAIVLRDKKASTSYVQRRLGVGYNKAASIIERMEKEGIVGPANHAGKREILVPTRDDDAL